MPSESCGAQSEYYTAHSQLKVEYNLITIRKKLRISVDINLKHLRYFWAVAHTGSIAAASNQLHLTPQTVSAQIKLLENSLGTVLFKPAGRGLELTQAGRVAFSYAEQIFAVSHEMLASLGSSGVSKQLVSVVRVGVSDTLSKTLAYRILAPVMQTEEPIRLICREGSIDWLLGELALHRLDLVLADRPIPPGLALRAHSHKLGESATAFFAAPALLRSKSSFPQCLNEAPMLLPGPTTVLRRELDRWLGEARLFPRVVGEFDDSALMQAFAQAGEGYFPAPAIISREICALYGVTEIGRLDEVREAFWLISTERKIQNQAVRVLLETARDVVFAG